MLSTRSVKEDKIIFNEYGITSRPHSEFAAENEMHGGPIAMQYILQDNNDLLRPRRNRFDHAVEKQVSQAQKSSDCYLLSSIVYTRFIYILLKNVI